MFTLNPQDYEPKDIYKFLIGSVVPRPTAFVTSLAKDGTLNGAPFSFFNVVASNPPLLSVSIQRRDGKQKDTARNIIEQKNFVIHIVDEDNVHKINETSATLPPDKSEIELAGLTTVASEVIPTPGIKEAKVRFECTLKEHLELGGDDWIANDLIIGEIKRIHVQEDVYKDGKIVYGNLKPVCRLAGSDYAYLGDVFSIPRPD